MQGILLVDKSADWTSFDAVNYVRKLVATAEGKKPKSVKVGHSGTLDPFATGLLILLVGKEYTRRAAEFSKMDKTYEVTMRLGETSTTGDPEGEITPFRHPELVSGPDSTANQIPKPVRDDVERAAQQFIGEIQQIPPAFSAIKINGQRAYKLARAGQEVVIEPRQVTINRLEILNYDYPEVTFVTDVSSGTYIRSLVEDLGKALGTGAYTAALRRTKVGTYDVQDALKTDMLANGIEPHLQLLTNE